MNSVLTVCLSPVIQTILPFKRVEEASVNRTDLSVKVIAGKGINVTRALIQKGVKVTHLTHLGGEFKRWFVKEAKREAIPLKSIDSKSEIRGCYTLLDRERGITTELVEETPPVSAKCEEKIVKLYRKLVKKNRIVIISGSRARGYSKRVIPEMVKYAKEKKRVVILDIKGDDLRNSIEYKPDIIKHNRDEYLESFRGEDEVNNLLKSGINLVITNGEREIEFYTDGTWEGALPKINRSAVNTTGCGDAFTSGMVYSILKGNSLKSAVNSGILWSYKNTKSLIPGDLEER